MDSSGSTQSNLLEPLDNWDGKSLTPQLTNTVQQIQQVLRSHPELRRSLESALGNRQTMAAGVGGAGPGSKAHGMGYQGGQDTT